MKNNIVISNAASSVVQIFVSSLTLLILYRVLIDAIGVEQLGVWSLVLATTSMAQLASLGITGSIVKFVAQYSAMNEESKLSLLIETASVSIAVIFVAVLLFAYPCARHYLTYALHGELCEAALSILPHALIAYWIAMLTSVFQAGLYGSQLITHRNNLLMAESVSFLVICYAIAGRYGLTGLAWARVIQNLVTMAVSWIMLKKNVRALGLLPYRWDREIFREILGYSMHFQAISLLTLLCDPLTKGLLGRFGSVAMVGYYEMANRLVQQFRSIIVSANQVLVPAFARLKELEPERIRTVYLKSYRLLFYIATPVFSALIIGAPLVSELWIGRREGAFVASIIILSGGWFVNTLCVPAYYAGLGIGELGWNVISHTVMAVANVGLGFAAGHYFGGLGVIAGWAIALALGGIILGISFHVRNNLSVKEFLPLSSRWLAASCFFGIALEYFVLHRVGSAMSGGVTYACFIAVLAGPVWMHPMRRELTGWISNLRGKSAMAR